MLHEGINGPQLAKIFYSPDNGAPNGGGYSDDASFSSSVGWSAFQTFNNDGVTIRHMNPTPALSAIIPAALQGTLQEEFRGERQLMDAFLNPRTRGLLELSSSWVVVPITPREVKEGEVLSAIAEEHLRLISQSGGRLNVVLVFNDYQAKTSAEAQASFNQFKEFVDRCYTAREVTDALDRNKIIPVRDCVSWVSLNDSRYQEVLSDIASDTGVKRGVPGKGNAIVLGVLHALEHGAQCIVFHDSDIRTFDKTPIVPALLMPLLSEDLDVAKLSFIRYADGKFNGRLTRGFSEPILNAISDYAAEWIVEGDLQTTRADKSFETAIKLMSLKGFRYPFSGEIGFRAGAILSAPFHTSYGLESLHLTHAAEGAARATEPLKVGDVMVSQYDHFHSDAGTDATAPGATGGTRSNGLHGMLEQTFDGLLIPLLRGGELSPEDFSQALSIGDKRDPDAMSREEYAEISVRHDSEDTIFGKAFRHWQNKLEEMQKETNSFIAGQIASHIRAGSNGSLWNIVSDVRNILYDRGATKERSHFEIEGEQVRATEALKIEVLRAMMPSDIQLPLLLACRLACQLSAELEEGPLFLDHSKRMLMKYVLSGDSDANPKIGPLGQEFELWHARNPKPNGKQVPLSRS